MYHLSKTKPELRQGVSEIIRQDQTMEKPLYKIIKYKALLGTAIICCMFIPIAYAQYVNDYKKSADSYYAKGDYYSAAVYYEKYIEQQSSSSEGTINPYTIQDKPSKKQKGKQKTAVNREDVIQRIAESYRQLNDYGQAEKWYAQLTTSANKNSDAAYWYGVALRANGKYAEAKQQFEKYLAGSNTIYKEPARKELLDVNYTQVQLHKPEASLYTIKKIEGDVNASGANYAATVNSNTFLFTSTRADHELKGKKQSPFKNALYLAKESSTGYTFIEKVNVPVSTNMEQGVAALNAAGNRMYITRWTQQGSNHKAAIYLSENRDGNWTDPVKLGPELNLEGYSSQQPYITDDNKYILFSSDRPGGSGKFDLWYAPLDGEGKPGTVVNFGKSINTAEDDQSPFYHANTNTLVFASKGKIGMGGFDLYQSKGVFGGNWQNPENMGYPVNSSKDDIYFTAKGNGALLADALISSDRASACCLDLFTVSKTSKKYVTGIVADSKTQEPLTGVQIVLDNNGTRLPLTYRTDASGKYIIELDDYQPLNLTASTDNYHPASLRFHKPGSTDADSLINERIMLVLIDQPKPQKEQKGYFDFDKYDLQEETVVILDKLAGVLGRESMLSIEITGYTDRIGSSGYNLKLSRERAEACKEYLISKGVPAKRITTIGKGKCCVTGNDAQDRKVEFRMLLVE